MLLSYMGVLMHLLGEVVHKKYPCVPLIWKMVVDNLLISITNKCIHIQDSADDIAVLVVESSYKRVDIMNQGVKA